jgi:hypothetical protein
MASHLLHGYLNIKQQSGINAVSHMIHVTSEALAVKTGLRNNGKERVQLEKP